VNQRNIASLFLPVDPVHPFLVLHVSRTNLVQDTIEQLMEQAEMDLKKPLKVDAVFLSCGQLCWLMIVHSFAFLILVVVIVHHVPKKGRHHTPGINSVHS